MTIAMRLKEHLEKAGIPYEVVSHPRTVNSAESAQAAHISGERVAKSVVIHHPQGHLLAVVPSTHRIDLSKLQELAGTHLGLAAETEIGEIFSDCDLGAVPPVGSAYGVDVMLEESLCDLPEVYFEGGDHTTLIRATGDAFGAMMKDARRGRFSHHV